MSYDPLQEWLDAGEEVMDAENALESCAPNELGDATRNLEAARNRRKWWLWIGLSGQVGSPFCRVAVSGHQWCRGSSGRSSPDTQLLVMLQINVSTTGRRGFPRDHLEVRWVVNQLQIIGNLGQDPEMRYLPDGQSVTSFSVAVNRKYKTAAGEQREETDWFNVSAWGKLGELANEHLAKGRQVFVQGRIKARVYEGRNGDSRVSLDVIADTIRFLGTGKGRDDEGVAAAVEAGHVVDEGDVDDLPF